MQNGIPSPKINLATRKMATEMNVWVSTCLRQKPYGALAEGIWAVGLTDINGCCL